MAKIHPVLLSGGAGSRLWPLSREGLPKQFLAAWVGPDAASAGGASRCRSAPLRAAPGHRQCRPPVSYRTAIAGDRTCSIRHRAGALARATRPPPRRSPALIVEESDPGGLVLLAPADHRIVDIEAFHAAVRIAAETASGRFPLAVRDYARQAGDRIWLHSRRRADRRGRALSRRGIRGKARSRDGRELSPRRRPPLEQRNFPAAGDGLPRGAVALRA